MMLVERSIFRALIFHYSKDTDSMYMYVHAAPILSVNPLKNVVYKTISLIQIKYG